jgi:hypothetical protein
MKDAWIRIVEKTKNMKFKTPFYSKLKTENTKENSLLSAFSFEL